MKNKREWGRGLKFTLFSISAGAIEMASFALLNELLQAQDEVDDVLGHHIGGGSLAAEEHRHRALGQAARLDLQILMDHGQGVHLLALILVEALDLHVEHRG